MLEPYPIFEIQPEWVLDSEVMGTRRKFWCQPEDCPEKWLFKYPRPNTGEHWAEKIAAEVASLLGVRHAKVELAIFTEDKGKGTMTESFTRRGSQLIHGNRILAAIMWAYDMNVRFRQSHHTLENIWLALGRTFESPNSAKTCFAKYLVLDALIGNTDRHHENWGIQIRRIDNRLEYLVAPSFDHASSLGRELYDERREIFLRENRVGGYAEKGRGGIFWLSDVTPAPSPLELIRKAIRRYPTIFSSVSVRLKDLDDSSLCEVVNRVPDDWMTSSAREFAIALMQYNLEQLRKIFS